MLPKVGFEREMSNDNVIIDIAIVQFSCMLSTGLP
jgi:hypothetical protein